VWQLAIGNWQLRGYGMERSGQVSKTYTNAQLGREIPEQIRKWSRTFRTNCKFGNAVFGAFTKIRKATVTFLMSVRPFAWNSAHTGEIFMKFDKSIL
jgi:hypothetical protein